MEFLLPAPVPLLPTGTAAATAHALETFKPDVVYVHKMSDLEVIQTLVASGRPLVRMVHDHDIYRMRSYKYDYFTRRICTRPASLACIVPRLAPVVRNADGGFPLKMGELWGKTPGDRAQPSIPPDGRGHDLHADELLRNGFDQTHPDPCPVPRMETRISAPHSATGI